MPRRQMLSPTPIHVNTPLRLSAICSLWEQLRSSVDALNLEFSQANGPKPTPRMCRFLIVGEDRHYGKHPGVDPKAIIRAIWKTYFCRCRQGGSTIAMQLVRILTGNYEQTWRRKLLEIFLAILVSGYIPKEKLPVLYLWCAYYGCGMHDFRQACVTLGINPKYTSELEDAKLIARLKYPQLGQGDQQRMNRINLRANYILNLSIRFAMKSYTKTCEVSR